MQKVLFKMLSYWGLLWLFVLGNAQQAQASHVMGSDLTYTCIGPNQYRITLRVFRDCDGISMLSSYPISYSGCGNSGSMSVNLISAVDITPLCPSQTSRCSGGSSQVGVEEYTYQGTITLPPGCNNWTFSTSECCRNNALTNVSNPGSNEFYIRTTINNTLTPCNSSPVFASSPTPFLCVNQTITYQQMATDPDGDQLVYSLVNCLQASGTNVTYNSGFSGANPLTNPVSINTSTGEMTFTATTPQVAAICVRVEEYRGGVKIGEITRDLQFVIQNCSNVIPTLSGINGAPNVYSISTCAGTPVCFNVNISDANAADNLAITMTGGGNMPGYTLTQTGSGSNKTATFCWTPPIGTSGSFTFSLQATDGVCPIPGQNSRAYTVVVTPNPNPPVNAGPDVGICLGNSTTLTATTAALNGVGYQWSPPLGLSSPSTASTSASPSATTNYTVTLTYADGCRSIDNVQVTINPDPVADVTPSTANVCPGGNIMLTGTTNATGMNFQWFNPMMASLGSGTVSGVNSTLLVTVPNTPGTYTYTLRVTNPVSGCTTDATMSVVVGAPPALPSCVNIYASPTGTSGAAGTQAAPTDLATALSRAACQNAVIKLAIGTYTINNALNLTSFVTIEGGFDPANGWRKTSQAGATTINRTTANPEGGTAAPRLVAFYGNAVTGFRLQDLTITTSAPAVTTQHGVSTYGLHLTACSNYNIVRCQILPGSASAGAGDDNPAGYNATWDGANGGNGANGATGGGPQCTCSLGTDSGGAGGGGGAAGSGGANATVIGGSGGAGAGGGSGGNGRPDNTSAAGDNGAAGGTAVSGGAGGAGGSGGTQDGNGSSTSNVGNGNNGGLGAAGTNGTTGTSNFVAGFFVPGAGTNGTSGRGGGGGGGGGGAARDTDNCDAAGGGGSGGGGGGGGGGAGRGAYGGGASFGIYLYNNGANGNIIQSRVMAGGAGAAGIGGSGGNGGAGGTSSIGNGCTNGDPDGNRGGAGGTGGSGGAGGRGGNGSVGVSTNIQFDGGSALATNVNNFNLAVQPTIMVSNVNCTNTDVTYTTAAPVSWDFDLATNNATPATAGAVSPTVTQYSQMARYNVSMGANTYTGFHNISFSGSITPAIITNATQIGVDTFQLCAGQFAVFESQYFGESYVWNFNGAIPNPGNVRVTASTQFNTPGFYAVTLNLVTDCCGLSNTKTIYLYVDRVPNPTGSGAVAICPNASTTLTLTGLTATDSVSWSPSTGIISSTSNSITVSPTSTTTYIASVYTKTTTNGRLRLSCPTNVSFPVTVNVQPALNMALTQPTCGNNGQITATITAGAGNYNFVWSNGAVTFNNTTSTINSLASGVYTVTATGVTTGCTVTQSSFLFPAPTAPVVYLQSSTPAECGANNGAATVATTGGIAPYTYAWNIGGPATATRTGLAPGTYCVTVTDGNTCRSSVCFDITTPGALTLAVLSSAAPACPNAATGTATVEGIGGQGAITYLWSNGETSAIATALPNGSSTVTATDVNGCAAVTTVNLASTGTLSTAPSVSSIPGVICPNTSVSLTASGGTAGTGADFYWYTGANGTGTLLGTGSTLTFTPTTTTTVYVRREGTCNVSSDASTTISVKTYIYALNGTSTNTYCTDDLGWHHFFVGDEIIFSVRGDLSGAAPGFPVATIWDNNAYYQETQGPGSVSTCPALTPGEERFEMERSWNLDLGGGASIGTYEIRFYYQPAERTAIENAAIAWMAAYPACGYTYKYPYPLGFYWFKETGGNYVAPIYDATHYPATIGSTPNSVNYSQWAGIPSFSGGSGAIILIPDPLLSVDWQFFTGNTDGRINHLQWATARESNSDYFEVQRSADGIEFQPIGIVAASGTTADPSYYSFDDETPLLGVNYYRLRLVSQSGESNLSNIVALEIGDNAKGYVFFPNPTEDVVFYQFSNASEEDVEIEVLDVLGKRLNLFQRPAGVGFNQVRIDLSDYPAGSYVLRATHAQTGAVRTTKVIKKNN